MGADGREGAAEGTAELPAVLGIKGMATDEAVSAAIAVCWKLENKSSHGVNIASRCLLQENEPCAMVDVVGLQKRWRNRLYRKVSQARHSYNLRTPCHRRSEKPHFLFFIDCLPTSYRLDRSPYFLLNYADVPFRCHMTVGLFLKMARPE